MRPTQLFRVAAGGLWRQKVRTLLTLAGVAVGTSMLALSLSLGVGLRELIDREFKSRPGFWDVTVLPGGPRPLPADQIPPGEVAVEGNLSPERAARLRAFRVSRYREHNRPVEPVPLTADSVKAFAALPDVEDARAERHHFAVVTLGGRTASGMVVAARPGGPVLAERLIAGRLPAADEVVVSEAVLYDLGARDEAAFAAAVGKRLTVELGASPSARPMSFAAALAGPGGLGDGLTVSQALAAGKLLADMPRLIDLSRLTPEEKADLRAAFAVPRRGDGPPAGAAGTFAVAGVLKAVPSDDDLVSRFRGGWGSATGDVIMPEAAGEALFRQIPYLANGRLDRAEVRVRPGADLPAVAARIEGMGFLPLSAAQWYEAAKREVTAISAGLNVFALVALFVAGLGITNTLATSVVERTREIGILRAVGASARQVLLLFLAEGALVGVGGGAVGLGMARVVAIPADGWVKAEVQRQSRGEVLVSESVFEFPWWLSVGALSFAVATTTLAGLYPARRAARITPVEALRHS